AGMPHEHEIPRLKRRQLAALGQKVSALAYRTDDVRQLGRAGPFAHRPDLVIRLVQRRTDEVVHAQLDDHEAAAVRALDSDHRADHDPRIGDEIAAGLEKETPPAPELRIVETRRERPQVE